VAGDLREPVEPVSRTCRLQGRGQGETGDPLGNRAHDVEHLVGWIDVVDERRADEGVDQVHDVRMVDRCQNPRAHREPVEVIPGESRVHLEGDNGLLTAGRAVRPVDEALAATSDVHRCAVDEFDTEPSRILAGTGPERVSERSIYVRFHNKPCTRVASTTATRLSDTSGMGTCSANIRAQIS
jgi:hypothetical protein